MGLEYVDLDETTREFMLAESQLGGHYISPRLTDEGQAAWQTLLEDAIRNHDDDWLAAQLLQRGYVNSMEDYTRNGVTRMRRVNQPQAAEQLAEGEFNRYYVRGLCQRAKAAGITHLIAYRGKAVMTPRPESEAKIGKEFDVDVLLQTLRSNDFVSVQSAMGIPSGPNSGLTAKLP